MSSAQAIVMARLSSFLDDQKNGLSKRELFAAMALQGLLSYTNYESSATVASDAVAFADSLIAELNRGQDGDTEQT